MTGEKRVLLPFQFDDACPATCTGDCKVRDQIRNSRHRWRLQQPARHRGLSVGNFPPTSLSAIVSGPVAEAIVIVAPRRAPSPTRPETDRSTVNTFVAR